MDFDVVCRCRFWCWPTSRTCLAPRTPKRSRNIWVFTNWDRRTSSTCNRPAPSPARAWTTASTSFTTWSINARNTRKSTRKNSPPNREWITRFNPALTGFGIRTCWFVAEPSGHHELLRCATGTRAQRHAPRFGNSEVRSGCLTLFRSEYRLKKKTKKNSEMIILIIINELWNCPKRTTEMQVRQDSSGQTTL